MPRSPTARLSPTSRETETVTRCSFANAWPACGIGKLISNTLASRNTCGARNASSASRVGGLAIEWQKPGVPGDIVDARPRHLCQRGKQNRRGTTGVAATPRLARGVTARPAAAANRAPPGDSRPDASPGAVPHLSANGWRRSGELCDAPAIAVAPAVDVTHGAEQTTFEGVGSAALLFTPVVEVRIAAAARRVVAILQRQGWRLTGQVAPTFKTTGGGAGLRAAPDRDAVVGVAHTLGGGFGGDRSSARPPEPGAKDKYAGKNGNKPV